MTCGRWLCGLRGDNWRVDGFRGGGVGWEGLKGREKTVEGAPASGVNWCTCNLSGVGEWKYCMTGSGDEWVGVGVAVVCMW